MMTRAKDTSATAMALAIALAAVLHLLPVPYSALAATGTWRSANRYTGNPGFAAAAKIMSVLWFTAMIVL